MMPAERMVFGSFVIVGLTLLTLLAAPKAVGDEIAAAEITAQAINGADLTALVLPVTPAAAIADSPQTPDPLVAKLEVLFDRVGASPGVIDGFDGENLRKAIYAYQLMTGVKPDGMMSASLLQSLESAATSTSVMGTYVITTDDVAAIMPPIPNDYGEMAKRSFLGYTSVVEELAERFHMDQKLLETINPSAKFVAGEQIYATVVGAPRTGSVAHIEADKNLRQVRAYDASGALISAYPATIGSTDTPSPTGTYTVVAVAENPTYTYNPQLNFKQGDNDQKLILPPGPNGPVGSVWIALSKPTFGVHGTPEPSLIDKAASHGCIRLTNWDAEELSHMVSKGVTVQFLP